MARAHIQASAHGSVSMAAVLHLFHGGQAGAGALQVLCGRRAAYTPGAGWATVGCLPARARDLCTSGPPRLMRGCSLKSRTVPVTAKAAAADMDLKGKHVVMAGLGISGRAAAALALDRGATVTVIDDNEQLDVSSWLTEIGSEHLHVELGPFRPQTLETAHILVLSPGIPLESPVVQEALERGVSITSELGFAYETIPREEILVVAVTGTNGKSTVTHFTAMLLKHMKISAWAGGNLGIPLSALVLEMRRGSVAGLQVVVVEVSSYQLEVPSSFRANVAVLLNVTPDHLDRHGSMESYAAIKCSLFRNMLSSDVAMVPAGDIELAQMTQEINPELDCLAIGRLPGVQIIGRHATIQLPGTSDFVLDMQSLNCAGMHNMVNAAVAAAAVAALQLPGVNAGALQSGLSRLTGLPHRMEIIGELGGVVWINDSKATNIEAAATGIRGLEKPAVVLLGGVAKRTPNGSLGFWRLAESLTCHRAVVVFGQDGPEIAEELLAVGVESSIASSLRDAVHLASGLALSGDALLLSPGCASFDEFTSFEHRGEFFAELMQERIEKF